MVKSCRNTKRRMVWKWKSWDKNEVNSSTLNNCGEFIRRNEEKVYLNKLQVLAPHLTEEFYL